VSWRVEEGICNGGRIGLLICHALQHAGATVTMITGSCRQHVMHHVVNTTCCVQQ
jgi:hypothetical protein